MRDAMALLQSLMQIPATPGSRRLFEFPDDPYAPQRTVYLDPPGPRAPVEPIPSSLLAKAMGGGEVYAEGPPPGMSGRVPPRRRGKAKFSATDKDGFPAYDDEPGLDVLPQSIRDAAAKRAKLREAPPKKKGR